MARLTSLSGVGKKTAQRLCMELGEKVGSQSMDPSRFSDNSGGTGVEQEGFVLQDAASALVNLGYPQETAWQALRAVQQEDATRAAAMKVDELIREALRSLV
jgi:Holliday junction DNA helicase RuvA